MHVFSLNMLRFIGAADYNFGIVPHFTIFYWTNNAHGEIQPIISKSMHIFTFGFPEIVRK